MLSEAKHLPPPPSRPRSTLRREWLLLALALLLLLGVVAPPLINLGRYQHRIVDAMSRSLGRPVTLAAVTLRLLPTPALVLSDVVVNEEPGFGAEPALRAPSVVAELRLSSLWRGRFEVSHVTMADASVNLARNAQGHWNIGSILLQASHVSNAPTGQRRAGPAPRFPYIEIADSRVNVKQGAEKLPYSLLNANLSMWLAEPDIWQLKLDGQPVRTDLPLGLADTGLLRVEGRLHRATALGRMPVALHADWSNAPLGQASLLLLGRDRGWRGDLHATADMTGELNALALEAHLFVANLHRQEFTPAEAFTVDATCRATYQRDLRLLGGVVCRWPVGEGQLLLTGSLPTNQEGKNTTSGGKAGRGRLALRADRVPASLLLAGAVLTRSDFAPAFRLGGEFDGTLTYDSDGTLTYDSAGTGGIYSGTLTSPLLQVTASDLAEPLLFAGVRLDATTRAPDEPPTLLLTTQPVDLGGPAPTLATALLTRRGFLLHATGTAAIGRLLALGHATRLLPRALARLSAEGTADFDVSRSSGWQASEAQLAVPVTTARDRTPAAASEPGSPGTITPGERGAATTTGWLRLHNAVYTPPFLSVPVSLPSAQAAFAPREVDWSVPSATAGPLHFELTAAYPLECAGPAACPTLFHLSTSSLDTADLRAVLPGAGNESRVLDQLWSSLQPGAAHWPALGGTVHADAFTLGRVPLRNANATMTVGEGEVTLQSLDAQALGGAVHAKGTIRRDGRAPAYALTASLSHASAALAGELFHEDWGGGTLTFSSELKLGGSTPAQLAGSAAGTFQADWTRGALGGSTPLSRFNEWAGQGMIGDNALTFTQSLLTPAPGLRGKRSAPLAVKGSIGMDRALTLFIEGPGGAVESPAAFPVSGSLAHPVAKSTR